MGWQSWVIGIDDDKQKNDILKVCKKHNELATKQYEEGDEDVGEELVGFVWAKMTKPYKRHSTLQNFEDVLMFGHGGRRNDTFQFFRKRGYVLTEYTKAIGNRINIDINNEFKLDDELNKEPFIYCSHCNCKYINDKNNILHHFGFNRLDEQYKTCKKCRKTPAPEHPKFEMFEITSAEIRECKSENDVDTLLKNKYKDRITI